MTLQTVKDGLKRKINSKLWCSNTLPTYLVITCMGVWYYTTKIHVTTILVILYLSYLFLTPKRSFVNKTIFHSRCQTLCMGENLCSKGSKYPISKLSLITRNLKKTVHLTASKQRKETFNCFHPEDGGSKLLNKTVSAQLHGITPLKTDIIDVEQFYPHLSGTNTFIHVGIPRKVPNSWYISSLQTYLIKYSRNSLLLS